jgi:thiamine pyrophosphate-dependent acetolactate synthase large subunit-like protein
MPPGKIVIHNTVNEMDINKDVRAEVVLLGDAGLMLKSLNEAILQLTGRRGRADLTHIPGSVKRTKQHWLESWNHQFESTEIPINPYRLIRDLMATVDRDNTIITHDAGSPREHLLPFWEATCPGGYLGWGKSTQLGHSLGLILGAKLAYPEKLCINWMGDAAFCMVGMDLDTAARNHIPILTIVLNNGVMACERDHLIESRRKYDAFELGGNYAEIAKALGVWSRRIQQPDDFIPALKDAISVTEDGKPALLECITKECYDFA